MAQVLIRRLPAPALALAAWLCVSGAAPACPFCPMQGQSLATEVSQADMVLYGSLTNAKLNGGDFGDGTTDLAIDAVIKKHDVVADKKVVTLPRYIPNDDKKVKWLFFCSVFKGKIDPYRGVPLKAEGDIAKYLKGAVAVADKDVGQRLRYYFDFLDSDDFEISIDAYKEFANADYKDYRGMAKDLPAERIVKWLKDPKTAPMRYGLYASMLGHCGKEADAVVLREMLDDPDKQVGSGIDGILAGYMMLAPRQGWEYGKKVLGDPKAEFLFRYAALRAVRFFWEYRQDVVNKKELVEGVALLLDDKNIADLAIEDLRKWQRWELTKRVLGLYSQESHDIPIIKRAILRFALSSPEDDAKAFVADQRKKDPEKVADVEELLKLEAADVKSAPAKQP